MGKFGELLFYEEKQAKDIYGKLVVAFGGAGSPEGDRLYGCRRGGTFESPKVHKSDLGLRPKDP